MHIVYAGVLLMRPDNHSVLVQIIDSLQQHRIWNTEDVHATLKKYPAEVLRSFTEDTSEPNWVGVWYREFDDFLLHSAHQPALNQNTYFLLGLGLTQEMWFDVLEYTEEDRTAHILQWGKK